MPCHVQRAGVCASSQQATHGWRKQLCNSLVVFLLAFLSCTCAATWLACTCASRPALIAVTQGTTDTCLLLSDSDVYRCGELWQALVQDVGDSDGLLRPGQHNSSALLALAAAAMGVGRSMWPQLINLSAEPPLGIGSLAACVAAAEVGRQGRVGPEVLGWLR